MGVHRNCNITGEMASLVRLKDTKTISNIGRHNGNAEPTWLVFDKFVRCDSAWGPCSGREDRGVGEVNVNKSN